MSEGFRVLAVGDVVGRPGREAVRKILVPLKEELGASFCILNAENAAGGLGITRKLVEEMLSSGADVITTGNHIWAKKEARGFVEDYPRLLVPANLSPVGNPGHRVYVQDGLAVFQLVGRLFMNPLVDDPFSSADRVLEKCDARIILVDFHAEATSEKGALAVYLDGRVSAVFGTHTHVQTSDERVLPGGTGFISDIGMTGSWDGIIGVKAEEVLRTFRTGFGGRARPATGNPVLEGAVFEIDANNGKCLGVERIRRFL
ncbi:MAG: TIGR00282 family metallophosphoesterase [candidate division WOR-3 bacterium]